MPTRGRVALSTACWAGFLMGCLAAAAWSQDISSCVQREAVPQLELGESADPAATLAPVGALAREARVFALGEPAHGAHEPLSLRNRLFEYLIEHEGFTAVALETSFTESHVLHDLVAGHGDTSGDLTQRVRAGFSWGFGEYQENVELLRWLVSYNSNPAHRRKVQFYGIDISGADNHEGFSNARDAIESGLRALEPVRRPLVEHFRAQLAPLLPDFSDQDYSKLTAQQIRTLTRVLESISATLRASRAELIAASGAEAYEWAVHDITMAQQLQSLFSVAAPRAGQSSSMQPDDYKLVNVRDAAMAENVRWVLRRKGPEGRVLLFAHNAHVMNTSSRGGIWNVFAKPPRMMGQHLRASLGGKLATVGILVGATGGGLPRPAALTGSLEEILAGVGAPALFLNLHRAACSPEAVAWLAGSRPIHANFDTWLDVQLRTAFDGVEFIANVSPAHAAERVSQ